METQRQPESRWTVFSGCLFVFRRYIGFVGQTLVARVFRLLRQPETAWAQVPTLRDGVVCINFPGVWAFFGCYGIRMETQRQPENRWIGFSGCLFVFM